ncbi:hypothetical protein HMPREF0492_1133 [Lactobacillus acidophilus ATCC 4796]|nr:hypothetical protein HMPREF0492_1133 [Lactobacillus acidophilus ATCC 4796]
MVQQVTLIFTFYFVQKPFSLWERFFVTIINKIERMANYD